MNESAMNLSKIELDETNETNDDENIMDDNNIEGILEEVAGNEDLNRNDDYESKEDDNLEDKLEKCENKNKIQVRRSERIKKRLKDIDPEDIGENDDENDKNYRG